MAREECDVPGRGSVVAKQFDFEAVAFVMRRTLTLMPDQFLLHADVTIGMLIHALLNTAIMKEFPSECSRQMENHRPDIGRSVCTCHHVFLAATRCIHFAIRCCF